jgi:hypothetical protein
MSTPVLDGSAPQWAQALITDLLQTISELRKRIAALEARVTKLGG